ncbi:hypothetical protein D3C73_647090 [compost metagenome]
MADGQHFVRNDINENLLPFGAVEVAVLTVTGIIKRLFPIIVGLAAFDSEFFMILAFVHNIFFDRQRNTANRIHRIFQALKINCGIILNIVPEQVFQGVLGHLLPAKSIGMRNFILFIIVMSNDLGVGIPRYGDEQNLIVLRTNNCIDHGIRTGSLILALVCTQQH